MPEFRTPELQRYNYTYAKVSEMKAVYFKLFYLSGKSSDGRVIRMFASGVIDLSLIPRRIKPMTLKLVFTVSLLNAQY